jgi:hypothetical protein
VCAWIVNALLHTWAMILTKNMPECDHPGRKPARRIDESGTRDSSPSPGPNYAVVAYSATNAT